MLDCPIIVALRGWDLLSYLLAAALCVFRLRAECFCGAMAIIFISVRRCLPDLCQQMASFIRGHVFNWLVPPVMLDPKPKGSPVGQNIIHHLFQRDSRENCCWSQESGNRNIHKFPSLFLLGVFLLGKCTQGYISMQTLEQTRYSNLLYLHRFIFFKLDLNWWIWKWESDAARTSNIGDGFLCTQILVWNYFLAEGDWDKVKGRQLLKKPFDCGSRKWVKGWEGEWTRGYGQWLTQFFNGHPTHTGFSPPTACCACCLNRTHKHVLCVYIYI